MKSIRVYLATMATLLVALLCLAAALLIEEIDRFARDQAQEQLLGTSSALSTAVDGELRRALSVLETISASEALQRRDWRAVDRQARSALRSGDAWIVAMDRSGRQLLNTSLAAGTALPSGPNPEWLWPLLDSGRPRICDLTRGYVEANIVCVDLPVLENGRAAYVLSVIMRPRLFDSILASQRLREGDVAALVDRQGVVIWRNAHPERFVGHSATPDMRAAIRQRPRGVKESVSLDGNPVLSAFSRSPVSGWTLISGVRLDVVRAGGLHALSHGLLIAIALLIMGATLALFVARRISRSIERLATASAQFAHGAGFEFQPSGLTEIDEVGRGLAASIAAQRAGEERFQLAQEVGGIGAWDWDTINDEGHVSDTYKEMHGLSAAAGPLSMKQVLEVIHPEDLPGYLARLEIARGKLEPSANEYRVVHSSGAIRWISARGRPVLDDKGRYVRAVGVVRDVTPEREAEQSLQQLNEELEARVEARTAELEQAQEALHQTRKLESMGQITGGVAHDFNNLLTPIFGSLDMLQRRSSGGEREQALIELALRSAEKARTLVQRLLAFARRQPLQPVAVDLNDLIGDMTRIIESTSGPRVRIITRLEPDLPPVKADPNQVELAILNLSVNARDAMPEGGTLTIATQYEAVEEESSVGLAPGRYVRLTIADTGIGMDEETRTRAIEPFYSTKGIGKGTGLGLSMAHGLAAQLGGTLSIDSRPGVGTSVHLWLPVAMETAGPAVPHHVAGAARGARKVLLVDDDELARTSIAAMLADLGFVVTEAPSAEDALRLLANGLSLDILITDYLMPGLTGADLARIVMTKHPGTPILIISGYADVDAIDPSLDRLAKPFRQADLAAEIAKLITNRS